MQGLQIDCRIAGSWVPPAHGVHLDGLLAKAVVKTALRTMTAPEQGVTYEHLIHDLPLDRHVFGAGEDDWIWKASLFHVVGWQGQSRLYMTQKTPVTQMLLGIAHGWIDKAGGSTIDTQRNFTKNGAVYVTREHAVGLRAWCVGDIEQIAEVLKEIHAAGVKTRIGQGSLLAYEDGALFKISPCEQAHSLWMRRHSPVKLIEESKVMSGRWRAPYWAKKSTCWSPIPQRIELPTSDEVSAPVVETTQMAADA